VTCGAFSGFYVSSNCGARPEANGTVTGRLGLALAPAGHTLAYAKGGFAWPHTDVTATKQLFIRVSWACKRILQASPSGLDGRGRRGAGSDTGLVGEVGVRLPQLGHEGSVVIPTSAFGPVAVVNNIFFFNRVPAATANGPRTSICSS